jgi:hypothetical protein
MRAIIIAILSSAFLFSSNLFAAKAVQHEPEQGVQFIPLGHRSSSDIVSPELHEEVMKMHVAVKDLYRDKVEGDIDVTLYHPDGDGPFPLVVLSHGRGGHELNARKYPTRIHDITNAKFWIRKGFAVAIPTRLGYGETASLGDPEWEGPMCNQASYDAAYRNSALQIKQTVELVTKKPWVDPTRVVLAHHSDRGSQYASQAFQNKLNTYGMTCSMSRKGNCWDNAPTESWFNSFKNERIHGTRFASHRQMEAESFEYIEVFYNRKRQHSTLKYKSPAQYMDDWISAQEKKKQVA